MGKQPQMPIAPTVQVTETQKLHEYKPFFTIIEKGKNFFIGCCGTIATREVFESKEAAIKYIESKPWDLLVNVVCLIYDKTKDLELNKKS